MSVDEHERLISAYLDGELTAEECRTIERRLHEDGDLARTLRELQEVSQAVRDLPQVPAPPAVRSQLRALLLQLSEEESLEPAMGEAEGRQSWPVGEVLSAYLDDELTAVGRDRVESLLADSPRARKVLGRYQAVRRLMRSLPFEPVPPGVLRQMMAQIRAEAQRNAQPVPIEPARAAAQPVTAAASTVPAEPATVPAQPAIPPARVARRRARGRPIAWVAASLALAGLATWLAPWERPIPAPGEANPVLAELSEEDPGLSGPLAAGTLSDASPQPQPATSPLGAPIQPQPGSLPPDRDFVLDLPHEPTPEQSALHDQVLRQLDAIELQDPRSLHQHEVVLKCRNVKEMYLRVCTILSHNSLPLQFDTPQGPDGSLRVDVRGSIEQIGEVLEELSDAEVHRQLLLAVVVRGQPAGPADMDPSNIPRIVPTQPLVASQSEAIRKLDELEKKVSGKRDEAKPASPPGPKPTKGASAPSPDASKAPSSPPAKGPVHIVFVLIPAGAGHALQGTTPNKP